MNETRIRYSCVVAVLAALMFILAAGVTAEKVVTVATYADIRYRQMKDEIAPLIAKKHPDIRMEPKLFANYWDKLWVLAGTKDAPDIVDIGGGYLFDFVLADAMVNLDPYVKRDLKMEDYFGPPWTYTLYPYEKGSCYAVPYTWVISVLYYNKDMFDRAALSYPDETWDWNTLGSTASKLTRDTNGDGKIDQWGFDIHSDYYTYVDPMIASFGGKLLNEARNAAELDSPGTRAAVQFLVDLIHKHKVALPPPNSASSAFRNGGTAMTIEGSWNIHGIYRNIDRFDWDVAMVPKGPQARVTYGGPDCWGIMRRPGQDLNAVWTVIKELISKETLEVMAFGGGGGRVPILRSLALSERWFERNLAPAHKIALLQSAPYMWNISSPGWSAWQRVKNTELVRALRGECSVEDALRRAKVGIDEVLAKYRTRK